MAADPLRCPACSGALKAPGQLRCEWCGAVLPVAPKAPAAPGPVAPRDGERDRLAAVLEQMQSHPPVATRSHGAGCLYIVLLLLATAVVFFVLFTPRISGPTTTPAPERPAPAQPDAERTDPPRGQ